MKKFKIAIWEEVSGFINVEAESKEKAKEVAEELMCEYGVEKIFYPDWNAMGSVVCEELKKYNSKHTHRDSEVLSCEEIKSVEGFPVGNDAEFGKSME